MTSSNEDERPALPPEIEEANRLAREQTNTQLAQWLAESQERAERQFELMSQPDPPYRMPRRRSNRVMDNWQEPDLLLFHRLDWSDVEQIETYFAWTGERSGLKYRRLLPRTQEEATAIVQEKMQNDRRSLTYMFKIAPLEEIAKAFRPIHTVIDLALRAWAEEKPNPKVYESINALMIEQKLFLQFRYDGQGTFKGFGLYFITQSGVQYLTAELLEQSINALMDELMTPNVKAWATCPVCERVFWRPRSDRLFCSGQCQTEEMSNRRRIRNAQKKL